MANLLETAEQAGSFKTLVTALKTAGLEDMLQETGPITVLAPTDDAFAQLPQPMLESLLQDVPKLKKLVMYHLISGDVRSDDWVQIDEAPTLEGSVVGVDASDGIKVNDAKILETDILTDNGVIHVIDTVLVPALLNDV